MRYLVLEDSQGDAPTWRPCDDLTDALATAEAALNSGATDVQVFATERLDVETRQVYVVSLAEGDDQCAADVAAAAAVVPSSPAVEVRPQPVVEPVPQPAPVAALPTPQTAPPAVPQASPQPAPQLESVACPAAAWIDPADTTTTDEAPSRFAAAARDGRIGSFGR